MPNPVSIAISDNGTLTGGNVRLYPVVALDENFSSPNWRSGGDSYAGQMAGKGLWSALGRWWSPSSVSDGYGFDRFYTREAMPDLYTLTKDGLQLRSKAPADATTLSKAGATVRPWLSPHMSTYYSLRIKPPFVVEYEATFPQQTEGRVPFSALWLYTTARSPAPNDKGREAEIDVEAFGNRLGLTLHDWPDDPAGHKQYDNPLSGIDLTKRHRYTIEARSWGIRFSIDGVMVKAIAWPVGMAWNQFWQIILNNSSGIPWAEQGKPYLAPSPDAPPSDMVVHSVRAFVENEANIWRNNP